MSATHGQDDYSANIDDQLLNVVKQEGVHIHQDLDSRVKLEQIAHAASLNDSQPQQSSSQANLHHQLQPQSSHQHTQLQHQQQPSLLPALILNTETQQPHHHLNQQVDFKKYQQLHNSQLHQPQLPDHLQHYNQQELDSEYNIQIPEPIIDAKSKIYPVTENTITAEGNLITRPYPEQIFSNRESLNEFIQEFARDNGFGVVIAHSNKKAIYYTCELGGRYRHKKSKKDVDESRQVDVGNGYLLDPSTKTKKLRCPFAMTASFKKSTGVWTLRTTCNEHNHPQLDPLSNHPMLRKRSDELNLLILQLYKLGTKPSHIESKIKEDFPDVLIKREDIYNEIRGYKRKIKKQTQKFSYQNSRVNSYKKRIGSQDDDVAAAAAAFLESNEDNPQDLHYQLHQTQQQQQQQQEEFQRQYAEVTAQQHQLEEQQYQQFQQYQQDHMNDDSTAAAAIAAVANAQQSHHQQDPELNMDNIDSRLVGE